LGCGNTNIVARPSRNGAELSKAEMDAGVAVLEEKVRRWRPEVVCVVGKSIWESVWRVRHGRGIRKEEFKYGWQEERENMGVVGEEGQREEEREDGVDYGDGGAWLGAKVFVASSTSGLAATLRPAEKEAIWRELGVWVERRREERKLADEAGSSA
jgi:TDG/mug DNA glycosylase family protein